MILVILDPSSSPVQFIYTLIGTQRPPFSGTFVSDTGLSCLYCCHHYGSAALTLELALELGQRGKKREEKQWRCQMKGPFFLSFGQKEGNSLRILSVPLHSSPIETTLGLTLENKREKKNRNYRHSCHAFAPSLMYLLLLTFTSFQIDPFCILSGGFSYNPWERQVVVSLLRRGQHIYWP